VTRTFRRWTTCLCLAGFAFAQLAIAAYACPLRVPLPAAAMSSAVDEGVERCPGHADSSMPDAGPLCESHCEGQTGVPGGAAPSVPPLVLAPFPVVLPLDLHPVSIAQASRTPHEAHAAGPPVAQRFCRLLI
jgi:hypothetical protein